ncbi:MAG: NADH-quinone oxidoreductase subunit M [Vicinamibacteria bacterium]|nr:NADH-quinone oxidoreductase subunit M [Vicinamibacteria bacterium]MBP9947293.1 NADH-quinone oxidoreductase subunit M [Vicinamibacteria bacterium]
MGLLSLLILLPLAGALVLTLGRGMSNLTVKRFSLGLTLVLFGLSLALLTQLSGFETSAEYRFEETINWLPDWGISYHLGIDGLSLWLIILSTLLTPISLLGSWNSIEDRVREFNIFILILESAMIGVFCALDLFLFYVFWEAMLIPMYFLIGIFGHGRKIYAAVKFFLYTMAGSALMLVAFLVLYRETGVQSFDLPALLRVPIDPSLQMWLFLAFALAFAIKVPMFPFHTWLPDAHVEAPTAGSVILAGVMLKMGGYGFLRLAIPLFPVAADQAAWAIAFLGAVGIVYGALVSLVQPDMKKLVAYSSVSHLGFVMLGIAAFTPMSVVGASYQMLNHGVSTGALFLMVGMLYERRHTRLISEFGGLRNVMPRFAAVFLLVCLSSIAVPGFNGFIGEFLILVGSFTFSPGLVILSTLGVILSAAYILWMVQRVMYGEVTNPKNASLPDLNAREWATLLPLVFLSLFMGVFSSWFTPSIEKPVLKIIQDARSQVTRYEARRNALPTIAIPPSQAGGHQ